MKAHYVCADCGTYFTENKVETTEDALIIKALGHSWGTPAYADGTVTASCTRGNCEAVLSATVSVSGGDGIEGATALTSEDFTVTNDGFTLKLPMSGFTAPDGKYFKAWQVGEVEYFPGELCDIENGATVTINAVWSDFVEEVTVSSNPGTWGFGESYSLRKGDAIIWEGGYATLTQEDSLTNEQVAYFGIVTEIVLNGDKIGDYDYTSVVYRPDAYPVGITNGIWDNTNSWTNSNWQHSGNINDILNSDVGAGTTVQAYNEVRAAGTTRITVTYANNTIIIKYEVFEEGSSEIYTDFTLTIPNRTGEMYTVMFTADGSTAKEATVTYPEIAAAGEQWASAEKTIQVGSTDGVYTPNGGWVSTLNKGEKVVLSGTQISTGAENWKAVLVGLYSGSAPTIQFRADNYIIGADKVGDDEPQTDFAAENWKFEKGGLIHWDTWKDFLKTEDGVDLTITLDWTDEAKIAISLLFTEGTIVNEQTYTVTSTAESGLADSYHYCLGYENAQITIDSIVRTHA